MTTMGPMRAATTTAMTNDARGLVLTVLIFTVGFAALLFNLLSGVPLPLLVLAPAGAAAYAALVRLGEYDPRIACDHVQSGEAGIGSFVLFVASAFLAWGPALAAATFAALLAYVLFISTVISPDSREIAINGALTQAVLAAAVILMLSGSGIAGTAGPDAILLGYFAVNPPPWALVPAALAPAALTLVLAWALRPELGSWSQGPSFYSGSDLSRRLIAAGMTVTRALLTTTAVLFAGWTCGIGISVHRLARGAFSKAITIASLLAFQQAVIAIARLAGPWYAWGCALAVSYALYLFYITKRNHLYDRHQKP